LPNEKFYFIDGNVMTVTCPITKKKIYARGLLVISDKRVMYRGRIITMFSRRLNNAREDLRFDEIQSIHADAAQVYLGTAQRHFAFKGTQTAQLTQALEAAVKRDTESRAPKSISCKSCGANVLVTPGQPGKCEYCNGFVQI